MKRIIVVIVLALCCINLTHAQLGRIRVDRAVEAVSAGVQSFTITDADIAKYADEYMKWMDANNPVCKTTDSDPGKKFYADRLANIVSQIPADLMQALNLNIQAYYVVDVNAFACPNGDIRIFAALMELMTDEQILSVIGHEIGHIANTDSKDAFVTALRVSALKDAVGAVGGNTAAALTNSQLGELAEAMANSQYSQKQEYDADAYGFEFLKKAGKDSGSMASALGVLLQLQEEAGAPESSKYEKLFSSHPDLKRRIETLNNKR